MDSVYTRQAASTCQPPHTRTAFERALDYPIGVPRSGRRVIGVGLCRVGEVDAASLKLYFVGWHRQASLRI